MSTLTLARELASRGHEIHVIGNEGLFRDEFTTAGVAFHSFSKCYTRNINWILNATKDINGIIGKEGVWILHSQSILPTIASFLALKLLGKGGKRHRLIFHSRGFNNYNYPLMSRCFNVITDLVIANSNFEMDRLIKNGLKKQRCVRIYNCVNTMPECSTENNVNILEEFGINNGTKIIGTVGRLVKEKAYVSLIQTYAFVNERYPNTKLLIIGQGEQEDILKYQAEKLGISQKIIFPGSRRDLEKIYPIIDIFVMSSLFESFCNVALEAASFGKPVVATKVGGLPEAVEDGITGILVPPANITRLAAAMIELLSNSDKATKMGQAGRERIKNYFTPERVAVEVEGVYEQLLKKK